MKDCIFCKIVKGEIPSSKIYEDELVFVFLDVNPVANGHILIVPKNHYENIFETPKPILERINSVAKDMANLLKVRLAATGVNVLNASGKEAQQSVFHLHYHIIPRNAEDGLDLWFHGDSGEKENIDTICKKLL